MLHCALEMAAYVIRHARVLRPCSLLRPNAQPPVELRDVYLV